MSKKKKPTNKSYSTLAKYIGMPFQLLVLIGISVYIGSYIDKTMGNKEPYALMALAIISLIAFLAKIVITESK